MRRVAIRGLLARKTRLVLTSFSVALGVMLIAGTYVFTDTINHSFDTIFSVSYKSTDVVLSPNKDLKTDDDTVPPLDASLIAKVKRVPGVADAGGALFDPSSVVLDKHGKPISGQAPSFIASVRQNRRFEALDIAKGRFPTGPDEVAMDKATVDDQGWRLGDKIAIQAAAPKKQYTLVGVVTIAGVNSLGGATISLMTLPEAQRMTGNVGKVGEIDVAAQPGTDAAALRSRIAAIAPPGVDVRTGQQEASSQSKHIRDNLKFLNIALLAFAGISLFVGAFIIFNTFSITVAQRAREFALLRTLGASRRQVMRSVLTEGLVLGALGSAVGLGLGIIVASGLRALFKVIGLDLPSNGTVVLSRTIIVSLVVGVLVTLAACLAPALRATRVPPVAALREGVAMPETRSSRLAFPVAVILTITGISMLAIGLLVVSSTAGALSLAGGGAVALFLGVALLSPRLVGPLASLVGRPLERIFGLTGRLARENSVRNPSRTATTAAALMVGVALVTFASVFAESAKRTIDDAIDSGLRGQVILENQSGFGSFSPEAANAVAAIPGVTTISRLRAAATRIEGVSGKSGVAGIDPATFTKLYHVDITKGGPDVLTRLTNSEVIVRKKLADAHHMKLGQTLRLRTPQHGTVALKLAGVVNDKGNVLNDVVVTNSLIASSFGITSDSIVVGGYAAGADQKAIKRTIDGRLRSSFPQVEAKTASQFKQENRDQINQLLGLIYGLLALSVIVSLFGIVNTLVLSITERTRELGMLRAIGTSRSQVKRMIRLEAVITAMIGGILGIVIGLVLAVLVSTAIDDFILAVPGGSLIIVLIASGLAGVGAAIAPARRAARLNVLDALAYE